MREEKRLRAASVDYAGPGTYFVTFCTDERRCVLGHVSEQGAFCPSTIGRSCKGYAQAIPEKFTGYALSGIAVMPNHVHALVDARVVSDHAMAPLGRVIGWWKARISADARRGGFMGQLWQPGFYERIIRDEAAYRDALRYMENNPKQWHLDRYYRRPWHPPHP